MSMDMLRKFGSAGGKTTFVLSVAVLALLAQAASNVGWTASGPTPILFAMVGGVAASLLAAHRIARRGGDDPAPARVRRRRTYAVMR